MSENLGHVTYVAPEGETTEWSDIQRSIGNLPKLPPKFVPEAYTPSEVIERDDPNRIASASSQRELCEMEDDFGDDRFLEEYRRMRMDELKEAAAVPRFGIITDVTRSSLIQEVTDCSSKHFVVVFLTRVNCGKCERVDTALHELSRKFPHTKFVKGTAADIMPGYPANKTPTVLVYRNRNVCATFVGCDAYGGEKHMTPEGVQLALNESGPVCVTGDMTGGDDVRTVFNDRQRQHYAEHIVQALINDGRRAREEGAV